MTESSTGTPEAAVADAPRGVAATMVAAPGIETTLRAFLGVLALLRNLKSRAMHPSSTETELLE